MAQSAQENSIYSIDIVCCLTMRRADHCKAEVRQHTETCRAETYLEAEPHIPSLGIQ